MSDIQWHKWFAWYPVWVDGRFWPVFLTTIYRRAEYDRFISFRHKEFSREWLYSELNSND